MKGVLGFICYWIGYGLLLISGFLLAAAGIVWLFGYPDTASTLGLYCLFSFIGSLLIIGVSSTLMD